MKMKRRNPCFKMWHDLSIVMSVLVIIGFTGFVIKDHLFASFENVRTQDVSMHEVQYKISSGDTLWELASKAIKPGEDVREKIIAIRSLNGLTPNQALIPGQIVRVPVQRNEDTGLRYAIRNPD